MPNAATPTAPNEGFTVAPRRASPASDVARIFLVLLALTFALRLPAFFVPVFNSDETFLATQAHVVEEGGQLYKDATDRKPPLVPYLYAATFEFFDTTALWSVRVVAMLSVALTALLLALEARRRWGERAGWMAGVLCVGAMVAFVPQDGQAANFEVFMLPFMTASILLARRGRGVAAGAAVAFATLAKQTGALTLLPVLYLLARARGREGISRVAIGFGVPLAVVALLIGPRSLFYWTVLGNGSYLGMSTASTRVIGMFLLMNLLWVACNLPLVWRLPRAWRERDAVGLDARGDTDLWLWAATAAVSVAIGLRFFGHYYIQLVPPLTLLTVGALSRGSRQLARATVAASLALAVVFTGSGFVFRPGSSDSGYESVSRFVAEHATTDERIFVWGAQPEIYWASGKLPATRFLTVPTFLTGNHPGRPADEVDVGADTQKAWRLFYRDFTEHPPRLLIDTSPANIRGSAYYPISRFPEFAAIVKRDYRLVRTINQTDIYQRKASAGP